MEEKEIWVAKDKGGKVSMYFHEPLAVEGEFVDEPEIEIDGELLDFDLAYEESPVKVKLTKIKD